MQCTLCTETAFVQQSRKNRSLLQFTKSGTCRRLRLVLDWGLAMSTTPVLTNGTSGESLYIRHPNYPCFLGFSHHKSPPLRVPPHRSSPCFFLGRTTDSSMPHPWSPCQSKLKWTPGPKYSRLILVSYIFYCGEASLIYLPHVSHFSLCKKTHIFPPLPSD